MFSGTQKPTPSTQASDWIHCEEEMGAYYQLSRLTNKLVIFYFYFIFKVAYFTPKKKLISKKSIKFIIILKKKI